MRGSVEQQVRVAYIGALAVLLVSGVLSSFTMSDLASSVRRVDESRRMIESVAQLRSHLAAAEAGTYGFLITGERAHYERYERNVALLDDDLERVFALRAATVVDTLPATVQRLVMRKRGHLENAVTLARAGRTDSAMRHLGGIAELRLSDGIATTLAVLASEERERVESSRDAVLKLMRLTVAVLALGFLLAISITALATRRIEKEMAERRRAESDALQARDAAEAANRAKTDFLARMSHELRTPLNSVIGFSNLLLKNRSGNLRDQDLLLLTRIHENGLQLLQLIDDLLDLSRIEAGKQRLSLTEVSLVTLVREAVAQFEERAASREITLRADIPPRVAPMQADARKLRQVLLNLIGNAVKFTDAGSVTVRLETDAADQATRIRVIDTGIGIPESQRAVIFGPFERGLHVRSSAREGTGLGLAIARSLCEVMGYKLTVDSVVGRGTTFTVHVRVAQPAPVAATEEPAPATV